MKTHIKTLFSIFVGLSLLGPAAVLAQTGVSDNRVSLPEGPGSLEGVGENVEMDPNMGNMSHSIAINTPSGFAAVSPQLSLSYSSGGGNGILGMGWSMSTPNIERMTYRGLPQYSSDDDFSAGGDAQIVLMPGTNPPQYRSRFEKSFVRYTWMDTGVGDAQGREGYWLAEYPDGSKGYFGATSDGTIVDSARMSGDEGTFRYMLVEKIDVYGHKALYSYETFGVVPLLSAIGYSYQANPNEPTYNIAFNYQERRDDTGFDYLSDAKPGFNELLTQRLASIDVYARNVRIRSYRMSYEEYAQAGNFTRLTMVEQLGQDQGVYPAVNRFTYSQALITGCEGDNCNQPFVVDMGSIDGVNISTGLATLIDMNGDALPDVVDTSQGQHRFFYSVPSSDGTSRFEATPVQSQNNTSLRLGTGGVQVLDFNGDGFTDLLDAYNSTILVNKGLGDWVSEDAIPSSADVRGALDSNFDSDSGLQGLRFIDYDNDKRIDLMRSNEQGVTIWRNTPDGSFVVDGDAVDTDLSFASGAQLTDMNGDGLLDLARVRVGQIQYQLNLGRGKWADVETISVPFVTEADAALAELEDLNGDSIADLVVVSSFSVTYALNNNNTEFSDPETLTSEDVAETLPQRTEGTTVLYADMNANGSTDIVWLTSAGQVNYLELFPVRPNLMTQIENSLGQVTRIRYGSSVEQMALDAEQGLEPWHYKLPHPMLVVTEIDKYEALTGGFEGDVRTGIHEVTEYRYHHGYYDGIEKQFRGYQDVEMRLIGDDTQEEGLTAYMYDVGAGEEDLPFEQRTRPYYNGLLLHQSVSSDARELSTSSSTYSECPLAQIAQGTDLFVKHICQTAAETLIKEGTDSSQWVLTTSSTAYDGYGNPVLISNEGVVSIGAQSCASCQRDDDEFGTPCGAQCLGDESYTRIDYIEPGENTNGRWILGSAHSQHSFGRQDSPLMTETLTYYDGESFEGLSHGSLDEGKVTRVTQKIDVGSDEVIQVVRNSYDDHGNVIETIDPNGSPDEPTHRRQYTYDVDRLRVVQADILLTDTDENPYMLRRNVIYESVFDKVASGTDWMRVVDGNVVSSRRDFFYTYDQFGRILYKILPGGDTPASPTESYTYDLGNPYSRVVIQKRSQVGGPLDIEAIGCMDGRGRTYQTRVKLDDGTYQVAGFTAFNVRSSAVKTYQPYTSTSSDCDDTPPEDVLFAQTKYDAAYRPIQTIAPDGSIYDNTASINKVEYKPLTTLSYDREDTDPASPHYNTPTATHTNGLGQTTFIERMLSSVRTETTEAHYDSLGHMTGYTDPEGNRKSQSYDLLGRVTKILDPNTADETLYRYDAVGNLVWTQDDRGIVTLNGYDGMNRPISKWDEADKEGTYIAWTYDHDSECPACSFTEGRLASVVYPGTKASPGIDQYGYDVRGRAIAMSRTLEGFPFVFETSYDNADRAVATTYPGERTIRRTYDDASRLTEIEGLVHTVEYDERSLLSSTACTDGSRMEMMYDAIMRPTHKLTHDSSNTMLQSFAYAYDRNGSILSIGDLVDSAAGKPSYDTAYTYDAWYRLQNADMNGEQVSFGFDALDNITSQISSQGADSKAHLGEYGYGSFAPNSLTSAGDIAMEYDPAGNMVVRGEQTMQWDFMGRMTGVSKGDSQVAQFVYGPNQSRIAKQEGDSRVLYPSKTFEVRDGISTLYVKMGRHRIVRIESDDLATTLLSDLDSDGQISAGDAWLSHISEAGSPSGELLWSSVRRLLMEAGPEDRTTYLHHDHLGSVTLATINSVEGTEVVGQRSFYPLGQVREETGYVDEYGFTGQEIDRSTGLLHFDWRYYDPQLGRWLSIDPLFATSTAGNLSKLGESTTGYAYVAGNFSNAFDPNGTSLVAAIILATVVAISAAIGIYKTIKGNNNNRSFSNLPQARNSVARPETPGNTPGRLSAAGSVALPETPGNTPGRRSSEGQVRPELNRQSSEGVQRVTRRSSSVSSVASEPGGTAGSGPWPTSTSTPGEKAGMDRRGSREGVKRKVSKRRVSRAKAH